MKIDRDVLRDHFVADFHKLGRVHDILDGWEGRLVRDVEDHFSGKGYRIYGDFQSFMKGEVGSLSVNLMGLWLSVPEDVAAKIVVFGEVPSLHKI